MASNDGQASKSVESADDSSLHRTRAPTAFAPVKDDSGSSKISLQGAASEGSAMLTTSATASKMDFLPRLKRQGHQEAMQAAAGPSTPSMAQRLERMRIEDRRRKRNEERRDAQRRGQPMLASGPAPSSTSAIASSASASSRAGALYLSSERLARQDAIEAQRKRTIRQTFAGPAPPTSWMGATPAAQDSEDPAPSTDLEVPTVPRVDRRKVLTAVRHFFPDHNEVSRGSMTLADHCLCSLYDHLISRKNDSDNVADHSEDLHAIPSHLKERLLALCGRLALTEPMRESFLTDLFCKYTHLDDNDREKGEAEVSEPHAHQTPTEADDFVEDWDASSEENVSSRTLADGCSTLDLSFASVSTRAISDLLFSTDLRASHIRTLSLAGWGNTVSSVTSGQGAAHKCLRASTRLLNILDQLVNLQVLSLAASKLLPNEGYGDADAEDGHVTSIDVTSEAIAFLKKLARRTSRLTLLDLSFNRWLNGAVLANLGWYTSTVPVRRLMWTKLEKLVLVGCPAFSDPAKGNLIDGDSVAFVESTGFSAPWHAAHHGMRQATDSVYFLHHKPGLGRALLADGYRAWEHVGRHSLIGREAAALSLHSGLAGPSAAANARLARRQARAHEGQGPSAFDDDDEVAVGDRVGHAGRNGIRPIPTPSAGFAISHGVAPFARPSAQFGQGPRSERADPRHPDESSTSVPRCPVSRKQGTQTEWERARVLDAVRGRWGSAILGTIDDGDPSDDSERASEGHRSTKRRLGVFTSVYF